MAENPVPFTHAKQVGFNLSCSPLPITLKQRDNSKVSFSISTGGIYEVLGVNTFRKPTGTHYLSHSSDYVDSPSIDIVRLWFSTIRYGKEVSAKGTLKKSLLPPRWRLLMQQIIQCLGGKTGGFDQITNKDAVILYCLANGVNLDYAMIFWEDIINKLKKKNREKVIPYTRFLSLLMMQKMKDGCGDGDVTIHPTQIFCVNNWALKPNQREGQPFTAHMMAIFNTEKPHSLAPKLTILKERKKEFSSAIDSNQNQTLASTSVVVEMHKEDQQETGGLTSLGVTSKGRANPQLSSDSTAEADPGLSAPMTLYLNNKVWMKKLKILHLIIHLKGANSIARQVEKEEASSTIKLEDLAKLVSNVQPSFKDLDSPEDDLVIMVDNSNEDEGDEIHTTTNDEIGDTSVPKSSSPSSLPTELKDLPSKFNELTEKVKGLKKQVHELEIELPGELKEIPTKLEDFTKTIINGRYIHLNEEEIIHQKKLEEDAKAEETKQEGEYDRYCDKLLNIRAEPRITSCDVLTKKGLITLKVYREGVTSEVIPNFKANDLHLVDDHCLRFNGGVVVKEGGGGGYEMVKIIQQKMKADQDDDGANNEYGLKKNPKRSWRVTSLNSVKDFGIFLPRKKSSFTCRAVVVERWSSGGGVVVMIDW
nr:zinc finger C2H2-type/integrase DNA-binding domain-containing protein [Tanacetum cinerariifolium]